MGTNKPINESASLETIEQLYNGMILIERDYPHTARISIRYLHPQIASFVKNRKKFSLELIRGTRSVEFEANDKTLIVKTNDGLNISKVIGLGGLNPHQQTILVCENEKSLLSLMQSFIDCINKLIHVVHTFAHTTEEETMGPTLYVSMKGKTLDKSLYTSIPESNSLVLID